MKKIADVDNAGDTFDRESQNAIKEKLKADGVTDEAHLTIISDEYAGRGGSYIFDPVTKLRTLNESLEFTAN